MILMGDLHSFRLNSCSITLAVVAVGGAQRAHL